MRWCTTVKRTRSNKVIKSVKGFLLAFFPRASERRVLLIVGVCQTFSHLHILT